MKKMLFVAAMIVCSILAKAQVTPFNGLDNNLGNLFRTSDAKTRSISPENFTGEKGKGGMAKLGEGAASYAGLHQVIRPDGTYAANTRFGLYRWHIKDLVRFEKDLKITIQDLGWRSGRRYLKQGSDISSVAIWYQMEPHAKFPELPSKDDLEVR